MKYRRTKSLVHLIPVCPRLFDRHGEGFIPVLRFREILMEVDEDFTEEELEGVISEVILTTLTCGHL